MSTLTVVLKSFLDRPKFRKWLQDQNLHATTMIGDDQLQNISSDSSTLANMGRYFYVETDDLEFLKNQIMSLDFVDGAYVQPGAGLPNL